MNRYPDMAASALTEALADRLEVPVEPAGRRHRARWACWASCGGHLRPGRRGGLRLALVRGLPDRGRRSPARRAGDGAAGRRRPPRPRRRWRPRSPTRTRMVLVCTPEQPDRPGRARTPSWTRSSTRVPSDVLVVLDEAYLEFVTRPGRPRRPGGVPHAAQRRGAAHLLQGLRAGRPAGRLRRGARARRRRRCARRRSRSASATIAQAAAVASLDASTSCRCGSRRWSPSATRVVAPCATQGWALPRPRPTSSGCRWVTHARLRRGGGRGGSGRAAVPRRGRALHHRRDGGQRPAGRGRRAVPLPSPRVSSWCRGVRQID